MDEAEKSALKEAIKDMDDILRAIGKSDKLSKETVLQGLGRLREIVGYFAAQAIK